MSKLQELEKQIQLLEGKLRILTKQNEQLKGSYNKALNDGLEKLNQVQKSLECERSRFLGLSQPMTPKTVVASNYEDLLLNHIRKSEDFKNCVKCLQEGKVKEFVLGQDICSF